MATINGTPALFARWRLHGTVGATTIDHYVMVPNEWQWAKHRDVVKLIDPCTGEATMLRATATAAKRFGRPTFNIEGANRAAVLAELWSAWALGGPWTIVSPAGTLTVVVDDTQGDPTEQRFGTFIAFSLGLQEI